MAGRTDVDGQLPGRRASGERRSARGAADIDEMQVWMMSHRFSLVTAERHKPCRHSVVGLNARPASSVPSSVSFEHEGGRSDLGTSRVGDGAHANVRRCARSMAEQLPTYCHLGRRRHRWAGSDRPTGRHSSSGDSDSAWPGSAKRRTSNLRELGGRRGPERIPSVAARRGFSCGVGGLFQSGSTRRVPARHHSPA